jgi:SpoVK/Ycf46/Vps4 family AAA+-type ATPase
MASAEQIIALIRSHLERDDDRFLAVAMQVAAHEARQGHGRVADGIRELVDKIRSAAGRADPQAPIPIATPRGELAGLLAVSYPRTRLSEMVLAPEIRARLDRILREQTGRDRLAAHGLHPRRKLLLMGPPGSGKTMTATALAGELHLPLYLIVLDGLITRFMGETAAKLRLVFDALTKNRGVYLFDEFDAIGSERATPNDVGEIRRVLNSFLQFLEQDASDSLIVAATNHPAALDSALFRRFDDVVQYDHPTHALVTDALRNRLSPFDTRELCWSRAAQAAEGLSYADIALACESAAKEAILDGTDHVDTDRLINAIRERQESHRHLC